MPQNRVVTWAELHAKYARTLWALHSAWALLSGIAVLILAHNRYGFLRWIVVFVLIIWASTLFFSRRVEATTRAERIAHGFVSYVTRALYQETLFFLIPFYFYSATFPSWNFLYVVALATLAVLSCFDELFDRLLRQHRWFAIGFFAFVSFSALQLFLPLLFRVHVAFGVWLSATVSFVAAFAIARRWQDLREPRRLANAIAIFAATLLAVELFRPALPPVPLRLTRLRLAGAIDRRTLSTSASIDREVQASQLPRGRIYAVATVFAPGPLPAQMQMRFLEGGKALRTSRLVELTAQRDGFRIWDSLRVPEGTRPQTFRVEVWTGRQLLGKRTVRVIR
jgi:hypothetical protein